MRTNDFVDRVDRQCGSKHVFSSKGHAKRFAKRKNFRELAAYRCPHCRKWHLGNNR